MLTGSLLRQQFEESTEVNVPALLEEPAEVTCHSVTK